MRAPLGIAQVRKKKEGKSFKEAGAELGQAQFKLELDFTFRFCRFGYSIFRWIYLVLLGLIE